MALMSTLTDDFRVPFNYARWTVSSLAFDASSDGFVLLGNNALEVGWVRSVENFTLDSIVVGAFAVDSYFDTEANHWFTAYGQVVLLSPADAPLTAISIEFVNWPSAPHEITFRFFSYVGGEPTSLSYVYTSSTFAWFKIEALPAGVRISSSADLSTWTQRLWHPEPVSGDQWQVYAEGRGMILHNINYLPDPEPPPAPLVARLKVKVP